MTGTPPAVTVSLLTRMLREAFEGPPGPWTYFTDTSPATGVFGTIDGLSAADASHEAGPGRTTIAGHVHHLTVSVALSTKGLRGESASRDRSGSWTVSTVDDAEWAAVRARLREQYETLLVAVETHTRWDEDALGVAIGAGGARAQALIASGPSDLISAAPSETAVGTARSPPPAGAPPE